MSGVVWDPMRSMMDTIDMRLRAKAAGPEMFNLLVELVAIEGPCPGTADWARRVHAILSEIVR